jgi:hypothetical protein
LQVYRNVLVVANRGKTSMKVTLTVPRELVGCLEIVPKLGYVQAGSSFSFQLKFTPEQGLLERCSSDLVNGTLQVPMRLRIPEQTFPVTAVIKATLTAAELQIAPPSLDFGTCPVGESVACPLTLTNPSALPLRYGLNPLPKGVSVKPGDGYGTLLPGESVTRSVVFTPHAATLYSFHLPCTNSLAPAKPAKVPCTGMGALTPLVFSANRLELPTTPLGCASTEVLLLKNVSATPQSFEFAVPRGASLRISPSVDVIEPGKAATIQVEFRPLEEVSEDGQLTASSERVGVSNEQSESRSASAGSTDKEIENGVEVDRERGSVSRSATPLESEQRRVTKLCIQNQVVIPCLIKKHKTHTSQSPGLQYTNLVTTGNQEEAKEESNTAKSPSSNASSAAAGSVTIHLEVHTTVIEPQLAIEDVQGGPDDQGFYPLDFDQIPVGKRVVKTFTVRHVGSLPLRVCGSPLGHDGVFTRVNALRELYPPGTEDIALVQQEKRPISQVGNQGGDGSLEGKGGQSQKASKTDDSRALSRASKTAVEDTEAVRSEGDSLQGTDGQLTNGAFQPETQSRSHTPSITVNPDSRNGSPFAGIDVNAPRVSVNARTPNPQTQTSNPNPQPSNPSRPGSVAKRPPTHQKVAIEFSPAARIRYREVLNIFTTGGLGATRLQVLLSGEGISPTMHLDPAISAVDLGHVLAGESAERSFAVVNTSPFALTFRLRLNGTLRRNRNGMEVRGIGSLE